MPWYPIEFDPMIAIAAASFHESGRLLEANAGFRRLVGMQPAQPTGNCVSQFFLQPLFSDLVNQNAGIDGDIHRGPLIIGERAGRRWSLLAHVWRAGGVLRLLAEHDIVKLEQLCDVTLQLNGDYANAQEHFAEIKRTSQHGKRMALTPAFTDPLTGVGNRRRLGQALSFEIERSKRTGEPLCAFMADLDCFKCVNDRLGHQVGDKVLMAFADLLLQHTRRNDVVTRFGGDEFIVLLPQTTLDDALAAAEHIRAACASLKVDPMPEPITASLGVAQLRDNEDGSSLILRIDRALYKAKEMGRNRVVDGQQ